MSDAPTSGLEPPSRFMMGLEDDPAQNDEAMDAAIAKAFGVDANDLTVGNPNNVTDGDTDGADGGSVDGEPIDDAGTTQPGTTVSTSIGDEPTADNSGQGQGGDGNDVATGEVDFAALFTQRYGRKPTAQEYEGLLELANWANNLTPEQQDAINRALTNPTQVQGPNPSPSVPEPAVNALDDDPVLKAAVEQYGEDDPIVVHLRNQQAELQQLRTNYQQDFAARQREAAVSAINSASDMFKGRMEIEDADLQRLQGAVTNAGIFPAFVQANGGNVELAMSAALDWAYWQDEVCRERELAKRVQTHPSVQQQHKARTTKAASVTGTGGNGADRNAAPSAQPNDPWAAVAQGLREAQNNGVPS